MLQRSQIFSKHLTRHDPCPPLEEGSLRLYNTAFCPHGHRVILVAAAKQIPLDIVNIDLNNPPDWMKMKGFHGVPVLDTDRLPIKDSLDICEYLDEFVEKSECRKMMPNDVGQKEEDKIWAEQFQDVIQLMGTLFFKAFDTDSAIPLLLELDTVLKLFDAEIERRETNNFGGSTAGFLDYAIWPFLERLPIFEMLFPEAYKQLEGELEEHKNLETWKQRMLKDSAVKLAFLDKTQHYKYIKSRRDILQGISKNVDYDINDFVSK